MTKPNTSRPQKAKKNVPALRFKEFEGEWEEVKFLVLISSMDSGWSPQCEQFPSDINEWGVLKTTAVVWEGFNAEENKKLPTHFQPRKELEVQTSDILITRAGPSNRVGVAVYIDDVRPKLMLSDKLIRIRTNQNNSSKFIAILLANYRAQKQLVSKSSGLATSQTNISQKILKNTKLICPSLPEQQKIASFLSAIDQKIQQLNRKKALLAQYKKGIMQQLFSRQIRFKDENGEDFPDWEEKRLGETLKIGSGKDYKHLEKGEIPVFGTGGYMLSVNKMLYNGESVFIGRKGTINKPFYFNGPFWTVDTLFYTHKFEGVIPKFIYAVFQQINWKLYNEASGVPSLSKTTIQKITLQVPSLPEQQKIANFLSSLDSKLEKLGQQIAETQTFKKGLLQQLFV